MSSCSSSTAAKDMFAVPMEKPWITSLEETINNYSSNNNSRLTRNNFPTIFKVPNYLRSHDPKAYEPVIVSLGPYHHHCSKDHLQPPSIDKLKLYYLKKFLQRSSKYSFTDYINMIKDREMEARTAYSEEVNMSSDYFVRMMLLDCCFVLEIINSISQVIYANEYNQVVDEDIKTELLVNPILRISGSQEALKFDLLLLENQLPFFLLKLLFDCVYENQNFLSWVISHFPLAMFNRSTFADSFGEVYHLLHLLHLSMAPPACFTMRSSPEVNRVEYCPSAMQLIEAGVNFEKNHENNFLCITFDKKKMEIAKLEVDDYTNIHLRNYIAFEQTCDMPDIMKYFTAYALLMECIINTEADVNFLQEKGIIMNSLGNGEEVACLFNNLGKGVVVNVEQGYLSNVFKSVNEHCNNSRNRWKTKLNHDYFSDPWTGPSLFGSVTVFLLTGVVSTIYTVLSYYK